MLRANHLVKRHEQGARWDARAERQWAGRRSARNRGHECVALVVRFVQKILPSAPCSDIHAPLSSDPVAGLCVEHRPVVQHVPCELHALRLLDVVQRHEPRLRDLVEAAPPVAREVGCARHDVDIPEAVAWHGEGAGHGIGGVARQESLGKGVRHGKGAWHGKECVAR